MVHILYIEADEAERQALTGALESRGLKVTACATGAAGLDVFRPGVHQLVLCDLGTPDVDGHTILKDLRNCCPQTPLVLLTTKDTMTEAVEAVRLGAQHFVLKPVNIDALEISIREALERVELEAELARYQSDLEALVKVRTDRLEYANRQLVALNEVARQINKYGDEAQLLEEVPRLLTQTLDFDRALLWLDGADGIELRSFLFERDTQELIDNFKHAIETRNLPQPPLLRECIDAKKTIFIPDLNAEPRWPKAEGEVIKTKAMLLVPLLCQAKAIGLIMVNMQHHERVMDEQDITRVETFASMVGMALDNLRAYQSLEKKVIERTRSLRETNHKLKEKAIQLEDSALQIGRANIDLLTTQEELEAKQEQTEQLLAQLSRRRDELRAILDASSNIILMVDAENRVSIANQRFEDIFGLSLPDAIGRPLKDLVQEMAVHFEDPKAFTHRLTVGADQAQTPWLETGDLYDESLRTNSSPHHDYLIGWVSAHSEVADKVWRVWIFSDVTSLKHADEQLRTIIDASPVPLIVSRIEDGHIFYANKHLARMIGYTTEELIGSVTPDFYDDPKAREVVLARLKRDGYLENHEVRIRAKDGSVRWCLFSLATSVLAGESVIIGGLYDISQRKEAEEKLKLYRRIFETSQDGIQVFDANGKFIVRNPAHERLTGLSDEDVAGKSVNDLVPDDTREAIRDGLESQRGFRGLVDWPTTDGETLTFDLSVLHIPGPDGKLMYTVGMGRDVTEQHEAQLKTVAALNELEQANQELRNAQSQLVQSEKMASLGLLVAGIAHEINTPVGAIGSMHDTLIRAIEKLKQSMSCCDIDPAQSDQMATVLEIIDDANRVIKEGTSRVTTIVRRLRSFARLDEADLKEVDIHEGIEDTLTLIHHEIKNRIKVVKNFGDIPRVTCFPGRLNQVFLNLLNNARQAIEGEGTITITTTVNDRMVTVAIADSGKGIAPDNLARVFDPGFTTKGVGVGTGLGLSICYRIMEDHRGKITAESRLGKGTTFTVSLPVDLQKRMDAEADPDKAPPTK